MYINNLIIFSVSSFILVFVSHSALAEPPHIEVSQFISTEVQSPNRQWAVRSVPISGGAENASLIIVDLRTKQTVQLCEYPRSGTVYWTPDSDHVVFIDREGAANDRVLVFETTRKKDFDPNKLDELVLEYVKNTIGRHLDIIHYEITLTSLDDEKATFSLNLDSVPSVPESSSETSWTGSFKAYLSPPKLAQAELARGGNFKGSHSDKHD